VFNSWANKKRNLYQMQDILMQLSREDYAYLIKIMQSPIDRCSNLNAHLANVESLDHQRALCEGIETKIRYLGSSTIAYYSRRALGAEPSAKFRYIIRDTARFLKVPVPNHGTDKELLVKLVQGYAVDEFSHLTPTEQQQILESLGIKRKRAMDFVKKFSGIFSLPILMQTFGTLIVEGLIKTVLFGWTARLIGGKLATSMFSILFARVPWWVNTIIPGAWAISIGLTALQIQGPARQKTIPILLYLGLSCMRDDAENNR